jgi:uncharacterized protein YuzE
MKLSKDEDLDVAYVQLRKGKVDRTVEIRPGILVDISSKGDVLGIEILSMSKLAPELKTQKSVRKTRSA